MGEAAVSGAGIRVAGVAFAALDPDFRQDDGRGEGNRDADREVEREGDRVGAANRCVVESAPYIAVMSAHDPHAMPVWHGTTILSVRRGGKVVVIGDGQVSMGQTVMKPNARKVRRLGDGSVIGGFAGATADAFTLFERLERKLEQHQGQLLRAAVELAKDWRTDKFLRNLEAMMIVADKDVTLILTGNGDVLEPENGVAAIGSGGNYALAAARALVEYESDAEVLCRKAMAIAGELCVYTNDRLTVESMDSTS